jgi:hypothetical protein
MTGGLGAQPPTGGWGSAVAALALLSDMALLGNLFSQLRPGVFSDEFVLLGDALAPLVVCQTLIFPRTAPRQTSRYRTASETTSGRLPGAELLIWQTPLVPLPSPLRNGLGDACLLLE